jgi:hypothetical protein
MNFIVSFTSVITGSNTVRCYFQLYVPAHVLPLQAWWMTGIMFLTNVFFIPFMALRAAPELHQSSLPSQATAAINDSTTGSAAALSGNSSTSSVGLQPSAHHHKVAVPGSQQLPTWATGVGAFGAFIGVFALYWGLAGRPEFGDLAARATYLEATFNSNRVRLSEGSSRTTCTCQPAAEQLAVVTGQRVLCRLMAQQRCMSCHVHCCMKSRQAAGEVAGGDVRGKLVHSAACCDTLSNI